MHSTMIRLLTAAQKGDEDATRRVAIYCFEKYKSRIDRFTRSSRTSDSATDKDDLHSIFFEAIIGAVQIADVDRGDPLFHIGQRGVWAVKTEIRTIQRMLARRQQLYRDMDTAEDPIESLPEPGEAFTEIVERRTDASRAVRTVLQAQMSPTAHKLLDVLMAEQVDCAEQGWQSRAADLLGVSPQRVSQVVAKVRDAV